MKKLRKWILTGVFALLVPLTFGVGTMAAEKDTTSPYYYNETDKESVKITVTISSDGKPIQGKDGTIMANLEVEVPYFDLADYGLSDYYRFPTDDNFNYTPKYDENNEAINVVKRPTALHAFIKILEDYYLEEGETLRDPEYKAVYNFLGEKAYDVEDKAAMDWNDQSAKSFFMTNFWGHDCNLNYYINHEYPQEKENWGATADYVTLEDGDIIDIGMFTDWNFIGKAEKGFAYFPNPNFTVTMGNPLVINDIWRSAGGAASGDQNVVTNVTVQNDKLALYDYYVVDEDRNLVSSVENVTGNMTEVHLEGLKTPGTYYVYAVDNTIPSTEACRAPAVGTVRVTETEAVTDAKNLIQAIGTVSYSEDCKKRIDAAQSAYDALNDNEKNVLKQEVSILTAAKTRYEELKKIFMESLSEDDKKAAQDAAKAVEALIDAIGEVSYSEDSKDKIDAAREAYNQLDAKAKAY